MSKVLKAIIDKKNPDGAIYNPRTRSGSLKMDRFNFSLRGEFEGTVVIERRLPGDEQEEWGCLERFDAPVENDYPHVEMGTCYRVRFTEYKSGAATYRFGA